MNVKLTTRLDRLEEKVPKLPQLVLVSFSREETEDLHRRHAESGDPRQLLVIQNNIIDPPDRPDDERPAHREPEPRPEAEPVAAPPTTNDQPAVSGFDRELGNWPVSGLYGRAGAASA